MPDLTDILADPEDLRRFALRIIDESITDLSSRNQARREDAESFFDPANDTSTLPLWAMAADLSIMAVYRWARNAERVAV